MRDKTFFGIFLIILGVFILASNLNMIKFVRLVWSWPLILVLVGVFIGSSAFGQGRDRDSLFPAFILIGIGSFFYLREIGVVRYAMHNVWPVFPLIIGGSFLLMALVTGKAGWLPPGLIVGGVGAFFFASKFGLLGHEPVRQVLRYWPVLLILIGLSQFARSMSNRP